MITSARWILATLGAFASIGELIISLQAPGKPMTSIQGILLAIVICILYVFLYAEVREALNNKPKLFDSKPAVRSYLLDWISKGGNTIIFSRDLSWVSGDDLKDILLAKAQHRELSICLLDRKKLAEDKRAFIEQLEHAGCNVFEYADLDYTPKSRFTIINKGRQDAHVTIGRMVGGKHLVEEFAEGMPMFAVADDLAEIIMRYAKLQKQKQAKNLGG